MNYNKLVLSCLKWRIRKCVLYLLLKYWLLLNSLYLLNLFDYIYRWPQNEKDKVKINISNRKMGLKRRKRRINPRIKYVPNFHYVRKVKLWKKERNAIHSTLFIMHYNFVKSKIVNFVYNCLHYSICCYHILYHYMQKVSKHNFHWFQTLSHI